MSQIVTRLTPEDVLKMPMGRGKRYELVKGELVTMAPAGYRHGKDALRTGAKIQEFVAAHDLGDVVAAETGFILSRDPYILRAADCAFVAAGRIDPTIEVTGYLELAPDFVVEVVSPGDTAVEVQARVDDWLRAGTRVLWVMYSSLKAIVVWRGPDQSTRYGNDDEIDAEPALPGFRCKVSSLFSDHK
jgi:Uma2 family endonuclease